MRVWILSDLHVDAAPWTPPEIPPHDVCIVAGDVRDGLVRSLGWLVEHMLPRSPAVVYVPGNHDFYGHRWQSELARGRDVAAANGIRLLAEGDVLVQGSLRVVGATLWTDYAVSEPRWSRAVAMAACGDRLGGMRDHRKIRERLPDGATNAFRPPSALREHAAQRARIEAALAQPHDGPTMVVTHHAPSPRSLRRGVPEEAIDAAYASDISAVMEGPHAPDIWIHGHLHRSVDYRVGRTRIVANPRGHDTSHRRRDGVWMDERENPAFDPALILEI